MASSHVLPFYFHPMKKLTATFLISLITFFCIAQNNKNNIWCFGDSAGIDFRNTSNPTTFGSAVDSRGSCVSIADSNSNLLFYAFTRAASGVNTTLAMNKNHQVMDAGDSIVGEGWYQELVIIPFPDSGGLYYLFSMGVAGGNPYGLFYSLIDMNQNSGLGKVIAKNIQLSSLSGFDGMTSIKHGNGRDWWLVFKPGGYYNPPNNDFYIYLITPLGISQTVQSTGYVITNNAGDLSFNRSGDKLLMSSWKDLIQIFDFDRCTGQLSNVNILEPETNNPIYWHVSNCFSPDGKIIYITHIPATPADSAYYIFQYDLLATNILASKDTICTTMHPVSLAGLEIAPDNKIYAATWYQCSSFCYPYPDSVRNIYNENLGVINRPDSLGDSCLFAPYSFYLGGKRAYVGLPNNPDYEMGPLIGSGCDSLVEVQSIKYEEQRQELHVFYHPGWQVAFVNAGGLKGKNYSLHVYDLTGREVFKESGKLNGAYYTKDLRCEGFANGMYVVNLRTEKEVLSKKFIKQ